MLLGAGLEAVMYYSADAELRRWKERTNILEESRIR